MAARCSHAARSVSLLGALALGCDDEPTTTPDAGTPREDAGGVVDASSPDEDAGTPLDDAGSTPADAGSGPTAVVLANVAVRDLALGGDHVYFTNDTMVARVPKAGGTVEMVHTPSASAPVGIAADDARIVWTERAASLVWGAVRSCPLSGCAPMPTNIGNPGESTNRIAMEGASVFWVSGSQSAIMSADSWSQRPAGFAVTDVSIQGGDVFWIDAGSSLTSRPGALFRCPATGSCTPQMLSATVGNPSRVVGSGDHVLVLSNAGLVDVARDGSAQTTLTSVPPGNQTALASDGTAVYWAIGDSVYGCEIASCTPATLATASGELTAALAVDATHVYWATGGAIRAIER